MNLHNLDLSLTAFILFIVGVFLSILVNSLFLHFSKNLGMRNGAEREIVRWASTTKPAFGGISFFILFLFSFALCAIYPQIDSEVQAIGINKRQLAILLCSTVGFLIGLADDAYNTKPLLKFSGQLFCGIILLSAGIIIDVTPFRLVNYLFTILWVVGVMNSINMLDNMDGIVSSISGVIILAILLFANLQGKLDPFFFITSLGVVAALIGFLFYNWHPSKMYMGDTGSQFLGAFLSAASIHFIWNFRDLNGPAFQIRQFTTPLLVFAIPLIDTTTVSIRRLMRGSSPFVGGKDHITHHLAFLGFKDSTVAFIYLMLSIVSAAIIISIHAMQLETKYANALSIGYFFVLFMLIQLMYQKNAARHAQNKTA